MRLSGVVEVTLSERMAIVFTACCLDGNQAIPNLHDRYGLYGQQLGMIVKSLQDRGLLRAQQVKFSPDDKKSTRVLRLTALGAQLARQAGIELHPVAASHQAEV